MQSLSQTIWVLLFFRSEETGQAGLAVPIGHRHVLQLLPRRNGPVVQRRDGKWFPIISYRELKTDNHTGLNKALAAIAQSFIYGSNQAVVGRYLVPGEDLPTIPELKDCGFISGTLAVIHEFTWHRLVSVLCKNPDGFESHRFELDWKAIKAGGWVPPVLLPTNLPEFPSALTRSNDVISVDFFDVEIAGFDFDFPVLENQAAATLEMFRRALAKTNKDTHPHRWAAFQEYAGAGHLRLAAQSSGAQQHQHLKLAIEAFRISREVFKGESDFYNWLEMTDKMGAALVELAVVTSEPEESCRLLQDAILAHQTALEAIEPKGEPQVSARIENNLGFALCYLGIHSDEESGRKLFEEGLATLRHALQAVARQNAAQMWASIHLNLGSALFQLGLRTPGSSQETILRHAIAAFQCALEVFSHEQSYQMWKMAQNGLADALVRLGVRTTGPEAKKALIDAIACRQFELQVIGRKESSAAEAESYFKLGDVLLESGIRSDSRAAQKLLRDAVAAFYSRLKLKPRELSPEEWALAQHRLAQALRELSNRVAPAEGKALLAEAETACRLALEVRKREEFPKEWADTERTLGLVFAALGCHAETSDAVKYFELAANSMHSVLEVVRPHDSPHPWAVTQHNLGIALIQQAMRTAKDKRKPLLEQAIAAQRAALSIWTAQRSGCYEQAHDSLREALRLLAELS
jgi:tetratricopeptide (TPR) repeat protein